jgi:hypothetical protein
MFLVTWAGLYLASVSVFLGASIVSGLWCVFVEPRRKLMGIRSISLSMNEKKTCRRERETHHDEHGHRDEDGVTFPAEKKPKQP